MKTLDRFETKRREYQDERTGRQVWQLTDGESESVACYMECNAWSSDDRYIFFGCNRTGKWQPYRLELETCMAVQIADLDADSFRSINVDAVRGEVYCSSGTGVIAIQMETLEQRPVVDLTKFGQLVAGKSGKGIGVQLNRDASLLAYPGQLWKEHVDPPPKVITVTTDNTHEFEVTNIAHPDLQIYIPGHINFCPADDDIISFCKNGRDDVWNDGQAKESHGHDPIFFRQAREYRINRSTGEVRMLVHVPDWSSATHCTWGKSGQRIYYHRKTRPGWLPTWLCSVDQDGGDLRVHYETSEYMLGHSSPSPDEKWLVTDSQDPDENILMLVSTERDDQHMLCWPNMSINSDRPDKRSPGLPPHTDRHTHPGFSQTGKYVHYTSDMSGRSQVYVVPVSDLV